MRGSETATTVVPYLILCVCLISCIFCEKLYREHLAIYYSMNISPNEECTPRSSLGTRPEAVEY